MTATPGGTATSTPVPATMCAAFQATARRMPDAVALRTVGGTTSLTWSEYADRSRAGQVRAFEIVTDAWPPGGELVTPTRKVRRAYADRIDALYAEQ
jgi:hypothetical protein